MNESVKKTKILPKRTKYLKDEIFAIKPTYDMKKAKECQMSCHIVATFLSFNFKQKFINN